MVINIALVTRNCFNLLNSKPAVDIYIGYLQNIRYLTMAPKRKASSKATGEKSSKKIKSKSPVKKSEDVAEKSPKIEESNVSNVKTANDETYFKVMSWNVNGVRAWLKKDGLSIINTEKPDVVCLQETKCSIAKLPKEISSLKGYKSYFASAKKEGYSGVALLSKNEPLSVKIGLEEPLHDDEGRCIAAEYEKFYVVNAYVPNSGRDLVTLDKRMDWEKKMTAYLSDLDKKKPVIYCGDLNVSHKPIDLANPKSNERNAGYTIEERTCFSELLEKGFIDSFRHLYPDKEKQYTYWTYMMNCRAKNIGWRLDYFVLSEPLIIRLHDNVIHSSVMGSDHCPIMLHLSKE